MVEQRHPDVVVDGDGETHAAALRRGREHGARGSAVDDVGGLTELGYADDLCAKKI